MSDDDVEEDRPQGRTPRASRPQRFRHSPERFVPS
jgi:hypothetical protein